MHFAIGTSNKPKSAAIAHVLATSPYTRGATFSNYSVSSGVPDMPMTLAELRNGAKNRAVCTRREKSDADYFVGMEGGVYRDSESEEYWYVGVVYIEDRSGI
jgi:inosine/xanthosine triphosphatase